MTGLTLSTALTTPSACFATASLLGDAPKYCKAHSQFRFIDQAGSYSCDWRKRPSWKAKNLEQTFFMATLRRAASALFGMVNNLVRAAAEGQALPERLAPKQACACCADLKLNSRAGIAGYA